MKEFVPELRRVVAEVESRMCISVTQHKFIQSPIKIGYLDTDWQMKDRCICSRSEIFTGSISTFSANFCL